ncbi:GNAT family N-acetyltransferase [Gracilimonas mengyeensis]|uniref:Ribosomal-protein-alanine N-acetyltransferase n=1 Tax=Gracilimonas mengyeensis TaxID=1302730 RepID=A0A521CXZ6_9BACT|nr:GNAT family N-acetyltransferase [Gracilimonas mengyeensis]SMO63540.1 ribosomal-protein-alanine N-acetyltransferase [Gracilimonas mengyeensis]
MLSNEDKYTLKTKRLILQIIKPDDLPFIHEALSNHKVTRHYDVHFDTLEETQEQMDWYAKLMKENTGIWWKLIEKESKQKIGACGFNDWNHQEHSAEIGFWLLPEYQGHGWMSEALPGILQYGFGNMKLKKIMAEVERNNVKSSKLLQENGFKVIPERSFKEAKNGAIIWVDRYVQKLGSNK